MKNKMQDLRNHLFATLEGLQDDESPMDIARARAVAEVAGKLIESAKVEVDFIRATGRVVGSQFIEPPNEEREIIGRTRQESQWQLGRG